eukprot:COSAG01_NODE_62035_length_286_cov_1.454545_1_plen_21_part_01
MAAGMAMRRRGMAFAHHMHGW